MTKVKYNVKQPYKSLSETSSPLWIPRLPCVFKWYYYPLLDFRQPENVGTSLELIIGSFVDAVTQIERDHPPFGYDVYQGSHYPPHRRSSARSRWHFLRVGYWFICGCRWPNRSGSSAFWL